MQTPEEFAIAVTEHCPEVSDGMCFHSAPVGRCIDLKTAAGLIRARDAEANAEVERLTRERDELHAEVEWLRTALIAVIDDWEDIGRSDIHPLIRGAALSAAGRVRDVLWPEDTLDGGGGA